MATLTMKPKKEKPKKEKPAPEPEPKDPEPTPEGLTPAQALAKMAAELYPNAPKA